MKRTIILLVVIFISGSFTQQPQNLFNIDLRIRVVDDDLLYIVVQIDNNSGRTVTELEGFITELDPFNRVISEHKIIHLHNYEPMLKNDQTVMRGVTYHYDRTNDYRYRYHINHIKFYHDHRIFLYSKLDGLLRIK